MKHLPARDNPLAPACGSSNGRIVRDAVDLDCLECVKTMTLDEQKRLLERLETEGVDQ